MTTLTEMTRKVVAARENFVDCRFSIWRISSCSGLLPTHRVPHKLRFQEDDEEEEDDDDLAEEDDEVRDARSLSLTHA